MLSVTAIAWNCIPLNLWFLLKSIYFNENHAYYEWKTSITQDIVKWWSKKIQSKMAEWEAPVHTPSPRNINLMTTHGLGHLYGSLGVHLRCSSTSVEQKETEKDAFLRGTWIKTRRVSLYCITHPPRQPSSQPRDSLVHSFSFGKANWVSAPPTFAACCPKGHSVCPAKNTEAICTTEYSLSRLEAERTCPGLTALRNLSSWPQILLPGHTGHSLHRESCSQTAWRRLKKIKKRTTTRSAVPLLNIYTKEIKSGSGRDVCTRRFAAALSATAKGWSQKTPMLGKTEGRRRRGWQKMRWLDGITWWTWVSANSRSWWWTWKLGLLQPMGSQRVRHDLETEQQQRGADNLPVRWRMSE